MILTVLQRRYENIIFDDHNFRSSLIMHNIVYFVCVYIDTHISGRSKIY